MALPEALGSDVQAWLVPLDAGNWLEIGQELLDPEEQSRAARFAFEPDRRRFVLSHVALRCILGQLTACDPAQLRFQHTDKGKPFLASRHQSNDIRFNLSHSGDLTLIATAREREIGVDLEMIQERPGLSEAASGSFSPGEQAFLDQLAPGERSRAFFRIWTWKEAVLKAAGQGITAGLHAPDLTLFLTNPDPPKIPFVEHDGVDWLVYDFPPARGCQGALAVAAD